MVKLHAYLNFNGNCEEAFTFYQTVFKTSSLGIQRYGDLPPEEGVILSEESKNKILHTALKINEDSMLMGSDLIEEMNHGVAKYTPGNYYMLDVDSAEEAEYLYANLSVNAVIEMPLGPQFFATLFASFEDQYGIHWMINFDE